MRAGIDVDLQCGRHCPRDAGRPSPRGSAREIADTDAGGTRVGHDCGAYAELSRAISEGMLPEHTLREATSRILALKESAGACHGRQAGGGVDGAHTHNPNPKPNPSEVDGAHTHRLHGGLLNMTLIPRPGVLRAPFEAQSSADSPSRQEGRGSSPSPARSTRRPLTPSPSPCHPHPVTLTLSPSPRAQARSRSTRQPAAAWQRSRPSAV